MILYLLNILIARWKILTTSTVVIILFFSLYPVHYTPNHYHNDKAFHVIAYLFLTTPISIVKPYHYRLLYLFFILLGGLIEVVQPLFGRHQDFLDFTSNSAGILLGIIFGAMVRKKYSHLSCFN